MTAATGRNAGRVLGPDELDADVVAVEADQGTSRVVEEVRDAGTRGDRENRTGGAVRDGLEVRGEVAAGDGVEQDRAREVAVAVGIDARAELAGEVSAGGVAADDVAQRQGLAGRRCESAGREQVSEVVGESGLPAVMSPLTHSTMTPFSAMALLVPRKLPQPRLNPWLRTMSAEAVPLGRYQSALWLVPSITICVLTHALLEDE
ncbi:hypothetical protein [Aeromicrobium sp. UC242_57]|uniref:hypothetical protein n=1 Tax=Aeromicrobium sp. UC242_57 TaxID=3374624 RepID=UPI0037A64C42